MQISKPRTITWWIAVIVAAVGVLAILVPIPALSGIAVWLIVAAFVLLAVANIVKGL